MSSVLRKSALILTVSVTGIGAPAWAQDGREWDVARARALQRHEMTVHQSVDRWKMLVANDRQDFSTYSSFLLTFPGYPQEEKIRGFAERALLGESPDPQTVIAFFDRFPPLSSEAAGRYATALAAVRRFDARDKAVAAWRGGSLAPNAEATLLSLYRDQLTPADHDARMNALLWQGETDQAERQISFVSAGKRNVFMERLALLQGSAPGSLGLALPSNVTGDPGYVYNRAVQARRSGRLGDSISMLVNRPLLREPVPEPEKWVKELLAAARGAGADAAVKIASSIDDAFEPGTDISQQSYRLRDDYTSLVWLGGTKALWTLDDPRSAAPLFYRYGAAAQTPGTRSKGFYWAGRALAQAGDTQGANRYFEMAAQYPQYFYGQLSLERLGRPLPNLDTTPQAVPTKAERQAFLSKPITHAVRDVALHNDWRTTVRFFREISDQAQSEADHVLVADLAREIGRRDLAVILGQSAHADGFGEFGEISYPLIPTPPGTNWTMVHAITRQESQFAQNAMSHAGARGLMQLMPGTAREQAGKMGLRYDSPALTGDASYNIRLGDGYFARMMDYYGGATPLAVAAYNAGPGNVNKWLRANGDPRTGAVDWIRWIEMIPIYETKNYVQRVLENAVDYEAIYPDKSDYKGPNKLTRLMPGKRSPG
ncbi:lytic transglycosylase domain-containing protein [Novosphingobium mangrovi (ex Huang et al. 2023)]|uniref:Lytic transglycosylase domain-containing protein n=1 Tax=Novosphingobium mangrovi (ex Huang et al. 2023) TaxID=2976432 RepID=A0ABT2I7C7_9SPHN|nr:lytic transglycosylase domain-containing protein [Novosphingobium mangrovi (ex Huang et al. 2023)]MCT2400720.1 lytic transglycosylase domain-containing protein [Novosphingobium mangrovi (ex Huang et al. 2023)]